VHTGDPPAADDSVLGSQAASMLECESGREKRKQRKVDETQSGKLSHLVVSCRQSLSGLFRATPGHPRQRVTVNASQEGWCCRR
jgi:hypothetical protein